MEVKELEKYKVGYTTGVFDLFHIGHLNLIKRAKECCEYLIVGVSTDEVVVGYKGRAPIIPFEERIQILQSIKYVDQVVVQSSMDKLKAWEELKFDVMFHGDDWKNSKMYKEIEEKFKKVGVEMVFFPYTEGTSSTILADVLAKALER